MKFCPNPVCLYRRRYPGRGPAEFADRATVCNDCGVALVGAEALGAEETVRGVNSWHIEREKSAATTGGQREPGRVDITTGWALLGLSALLTVGSYMVAGSMGGGPYFIAVGPLIYGFVRLFRGRAAQKAAEARMRE